MRSLVAALTAVALVASPILARAAEDGFCDWSPDPQLSDLSAFLDDADCVSAEAVTIDPSVETTVAMTPVFLGPRAFGEPSGIHTKSSVIVYGDPYSSERVAPLSFFWEQYRSFKDAVHSYNEAVDRIAEPIGEIHATYMSVVVLRGPPEWVKNADAAAARTVVNVAGGALALGPNLLLLPEAVWTAPDRIVSGSSKIHQGISDGHYDYAAKGVAEVCGGVGVLASVAGPIAGGFIGRTTPVSIVRAPVGVATSATIGSEAALATAKIEKVHPLDLTPTHGLTMGMKEFRSLKNDVRANGVVEPIAYVEHNGARYIVDGHHRHEAAIQTGTK